MPIYARTIFRRKIWDRVRLRNNQNFDEIFYGGMTRLKNTNLDVLVQLQHTGNILRSENMGQSLFNKYSKFSKFYEILYCGMTRFRNIKLGVFRQYQNTKTILKTKKMGQNRLRNFLNSKNFN